MFYYILYDLGTVKVIDQGVRADTGVHLSHTALDSEWNGKFIRL